MIDRENPMGVSKLFKPKPASFLDAARRDWQFATFAWLLRNTGGFPKFMDTTLILPVDDHFPDRGMSGHAGVSALFRRVRDHAGMADWPCAVAPKTAADASALPPQASPAKAAPAEDRIPVITYDPGLLEPQSLVASFARELARYLTETFEERAPGGAPLHEPSAELAAVFMGFGLFMANSGLQTAHYDDAGWQGWRSNGNGSLNEGELVHGLAMFCLLRKMDPESINRHLNPHLRKYLRMAARDLRQYETQFQRLRSIFALRPVDIADRTLPTQAL